jgi:transcriptional regulator with XRE-family HTH domain
MKFGELLKEARVSRRLSQYELAELSGIDRSWIAHLERGARRPTIEIAVKFADALSASRASFIEAALEYRFREIGLGYTVTLDLPAEEGT